MQVDYITVIPDRSLPRKVTVQHESTMGQTMTSETLSISGGDGYRYWVGLTMKPFRRGCKKTMYKGVLLGQGPRQWEKVVAKAFTDIPGTKELWNDEVQKSYVTKQLAAEFIQQFPGECKIRVVLPGIVQMDKVSNMNKWLAARKGKRSLDQDEWISIEELIPGNMVRYCPWTIEHHTEEHAVSQHLQTFSHFTYKYSNGTLVACDFQGVCQMKDMRPYYVFTDSTVHSLNKRYGLFDKGEFGITEFFKLHKCTKVCKNWPKPTPLTPPPSFSEACAQRFQQMIPPYFENIIFPSSSLSNIDFEDQSTVTYTPHRSGNGSRRRHVSDHQTSQPNEQNPANGYSLRRRPSSYYENLQGLNPVESLANGDDSQPPTYDSIVDLSSSDVVINGRFTGQRSNPNTHAVLTASNSCPLLDVSNDGRTFRSQASPWGRSQTCDMPDMSHMLGPEIFSEESRFRSWSENTINMNLQQRRLVQSIHPNSQHMHQNLPPLIVSTRTAADGRFNNT
ncbi:hypothetical protein Btru_040037 [Bulinus truncatus]|nr:hypothetical protein Btru_040037 [Bulinus truncatus]